MVLLFRAGLGKACSPSLGWRAYLDWRVRVCKDSLSNATGALDLALNSWEPIAYALINKDTAQLCDGTPEGRLWGHFVSGHCQPVLD